MVVASHIEGRVRIRDEGLKRESLLIRAKAALLAVPGVSGVEGNGRVGSLLVLYSAAVTGVERIMEAASDILGSGEEAESAAESGRAFGNGSLAGRVSLAISPRLKNRMVNIGMLASLALSLVAIVFDLKKLHLVTGMIFVALFGDHLYHRGRLVFA